MKPTDIGAPDYFHKVVDCQWACPAHTPVPEYIRLIAAGRYDDAYMVNWQSNVFPGILGRTCDRPCEPACRRSRVEEEAAEPGKDAAAAARRLARTIAGAPENAGEDVRFPVDHIRIAVTACGDQADVFGDGSVGRAGPLAINYFVEVIRVRDISRLQTFFS